MASLVQIVHYLYQQTGRSKCGRQTESSHQPRRRYCLQTNLEGT